MNDMDDSMEVAFASKEMIRVTMRVVNLGAAETHAGSNDE